MLRLTAWLTPTLFWLLTMPGLEMEGCGLSLCLEWKLGGVFELLTGVKSLIHAYNDKKSVIWAYLVKIGPEINKMVCWEPTHLCF